MINSSEFPEIKMPKRIETPPNEIHNEKEEEVERTQETTQPKGLVIDFDVESYKKHFQAYDCSSPSNARIEFQLKQFKSKNIKSLLQKKQIKVQQKYEKKASIFEKMLSDRIFSPRTFNIKKKELDEKLSFEKEEVRQRINEAKTVLGYFDDISSEEGDVERKEEIFEQKQIRAEEKPNFKKNKSLIDEGTNTSPVE